MRNGSTRKTDEPWRRTTSGARNHQKTVVAEQEKAQMWMKKTKWLHDQCRDDVFHIENQA